MIIRISRRLRLLAPLLALTASACATPQSITSYYTLMPDSSAAATATDASYQIEVMKVDVPMQVDVPQIVVRTGAGELVPVDSRRWIAPLSNELHGALSWNLTRTLGVRDVAGFGRNGSTPIYRVNLRVQRFDSAPGAYARIDALWSVRVSNSDAALAVCSSSANIAVSAGYAALAQGHQKAIAQISEEIAASIRNARSTGRTPSCATAAQ
ncbi:MAG: PqiC family protein [Pseudomonadota bacterium]